MRRPRKSTGGTCRNKLQRIRGGPTGEWCDLAIDRLTMNHDWEWKEASERKRRSIETGMILRAMIEIPFCSLWRASSVRFKLTRKSIPRKQTCRRTILSRAIPDVTDTPNYHVPERFIPLKFFLKGHVVSAFAECWLRVFPPEGGTVHALQTETADEAASCPQFERQYIPGGHARLFNFH